MDELYEEVCFYGIEGLMQKLEQLKQGNAHKFSQQQFLALVNSSIKPIQIPCMKLTSIQISYLNLESANLRGCDLSHCQGLEVHFDFANLTHCNFGESMLKNVSMR